LARRGHAEGAHDGPAAVRAAVGAPRLDGLRRGLRPLQPAGGGTHPAWLR